MRHLLALLLFLPLFASAQVNTRADNVSMVEYLYKLKDTTQDRINAKLDTGRAGEVSAGTKAAIATKRGSFRSDTFSIASNGVVNLQPWLAANGFTSMSLAGAMPFSSDTSANASATLELRGWTPTTVTFRVKVQNTAGLIYVALLGINLISGLPFVTPATGTVKAYLSFVAYQ